MPSIVSTSAASSAPAFAALKAARKAERQAQKIALKNGESDKILHAESILVKAATHRSLKDLLARPVVFRRSRSESSIRDHLDESVIILGKKNSSLTRGAVDDTTVNCPKSRSGLDGQSPSNSSKQCSKKNVTTTDHTIIGRAKLGLSKADSIFLERFNALPSNPSRELCSLRAISLKWDDLSHIGGGFLNLGNSCFINSTVQLLLHVVPLRRFLMSREHSRKCTMPHCALCCLEELVLKSYAVGKRAKSVSPNKLFLMLGRIGKQFRPYKQEDAHEFLRLLLDACQNSLLHGLKGLNFAAKETSLLYRVFGGYLQQSVKCLACKQVSHTYQAFLDLSIDIGNASSLEKALAQFCEPETLHGSNQYRCEKCSRQFDAIKYIRMHQPPKILTLQLKRFAFAHELHTSKISKLVKYPEQLDIQPFMSEGSPKIPKYSLTGVLVHSGKSTRSGHYYTYCKSASGVWFCFDDDLVCRANIKEVLSQQAYIVLYSADASWVEKLHRGISEKEHTNSEVDIGTGTDICDNPVSSSSNASDILSASISSLPEKTLGEKHVHSSYQPENAEDALGGRKRSESESTVTPNSHSHKKKKRRRAIKDLLKRNKSY